MEKIELNELNEFMNGVYKYRYIQSIEFLLLDKFPDILDLEVEANDKGTISIQFLEGKYTKEEVELFLNKTKSTGPFDEKLLKGLLTNTKY
jgi:hypothetical protein